MRYGNGQYYVTSYAFIDRSSTRETSARIELFQSLFHNPPSQAAMTCSNCWIHSCSVNKIYRHDIVTSVKTMKINLILFFSFSDRPPAWFTEIVFDQLSSGSDEVLNRHHFSYNDTFPGRLLFRSLPRRRKMNFKEIYDKLCLVTHGPSPNIILSQCVCVCCCHSRELLTLECSMESP